MAGTLNRHLCWWGKPTDPDNLVSWTSSLLFAFQYIFYRHNHSRDRSSLDGIDLCIVDTATFPDGGFLPDMDLIHRRKPAGLGGSPEAFYHIKADRQQMMKEELQAVINIAQLFGPRWRLPIAANLMALLPRRRGDSAILHAFRAPPFTSSSCSTNQADSYRRRERGGARFQRQR